MPVVVAEKPHCGIWGVPFMKSTTRSDATISSMRARVFSFSMTGVPLEGSGIDPQVSHSYVRPGDGWGMIDPERRRSESSADAVKWEDPEVERPRIGLRTLNPPGGVRRRRSCRSPNT